MKRGRARLFGMLYEDVAHSNGSCSGFLLQLQKGLRLDIVLVYRVRSCAAPYCHVVCHALYAFIILHSIGIIIVFLSASCVRMCIHIGSLSVCCGV